MKTINPLVVSVGPTADATPIYPIQPTEHGGGVKKVVAVAAMVVIPIAAPAIASSIAASGVLGAAVSGAMATTVGAAVSSAVVGAGLGAITAKVTGQNVKAGAIAGALGGGFGGYRSATAGTFGTPQGGVSATFDRAKQSVSNLFSGGDAPTTDGGTVTDNAVKVGTKDVVEKEVVEKGFLEKMSSVPSKVLDKVTNPDTIANLTLQAGGQLLATALIPPGSMPELSAEEQQVLEEYKAELADLKENNEAAFNAKMDAAQQYLVQAGYFNPEYFGLQAANRTAIDQERKMREYKRTAGLTNFRNTGANAAEERRMALQGARNVQSSFDSGFQKGMTAQDQKIKAGYGMIPSGDPSYANALANLTTTYSNLRGDADKQRQNLTELFGRFGTTSGNSKEDEKKLEETKDSFNSNNTAGLNTTSFA